MDKLIEKVNGSSLGKDEKKQWISEIKKIYARKSSLSNTDQFIRLIYTVNLANISKTQSSQISPQWTGYFGGWTPGTLSGDVHNDLAYCAGTYWGIPNQWDVMMGDWAGYPDTLGLPEQATHYATTGAPQKAEDNANIARNYIRYQNNPTAGYPYLGRASHYLSDLSNPYHYDYLFLVPHQSYESYVANNWHSGKNFYSGMATDQYYYYITDVSDAANYVAQVALSYRGYINDQIGFNSNWQNDPELIWETRETLLLGERFDRGLVNYSLR